MAQIALEKQPKTTFYEKPPAELPQLGDITRCLADFSQTQSASQASLPASGTTVNRCDEGFPVRFWSWKILGGFFMGVPVERGQCVFLEVSGQSAFPSLRNILETNVAWMNSSCQHPESQWPRLKIQ